MSTSAQVIGSIFDPTAEGKSLNAAYPSIFPCWFSVTIDNRDRSLTLTIFLLAITLM